MTILDMDTIAHTPDTFGEDPTPAGTVELVEGKFGRACRFSFAEEGRGRYFRASVTADVSWDEAAGISFWVKGDGSAQYGGLELVAADNPRLRFQYEFPLDSTEWRQHLVPWGEFMSFLPDGHLLDAQLGLRPSALGGLHFGRQPWWFEWPAHSFCIDQIQLEREVAVDRTDYTPQGEPLARVREKLAHRRPLIIMTMGDSLTSRYHWANKEMCWVDLLSHRLRVHAHSEVAVVNPAMGGHQVTHGLVQLPRWIPRCPSPDLVTIWYGGNDWSDGCRRERFAERLGLAVDTVRRRTHGSADILLLSCPPSLEEWDTGIHELGEAARAVAAEKKAAFVDAYALFRQAGQEESQREALFAWDKVHLGEYGHQVTAEAVFREIAPT